MEGRYGTMEGNNAYVLLRTLTRINYPPLSIIIAWRKHRLIAVWRLVLDIIETCALMKLLGDMQDCNRNEFFLSPIDS